MQNFTSWGRLGHFQNKAVYPNFAEDLKFLDGYEGKILAHGMGRSYSDVALSENALIISTRNMDRIISHNEGKITVQAGITLDRLLKVIMPKGYFVNVTPGTRFVSVGGAIANDVHGKNHHISGSFCRSVISFRLMIPGRGVVNCSRTENAELFRATCGGLGLTGIILEAELTLLPITSDAMEVENIRFSNIDEYFSISAESISWPYIVSWIDCFSKGRGIFSRARHAEGNRNIEPISPPKLNIPVNFPQFALNSLSIKAFNEIYYRSTKTGIFSAQICKFFYPLDGINNWNRMYGKAGFYQYQCVIPKNSARDAVKELLKIIAGSGQGSFLAVLKDFGEFPPEGLLSFPMAGTTLALDFPNLGHSTLRLFDQLDKVVLQSGGRLNPSKDSRIPAEMFRSGFPALPEFRKFRHENISSAFWERVG